MGAVRDGLMFCVAQSKDQRGLARKSMRVSVAADFLETRVQTGEPYLLFIDAVNRALPKLQRELGLKCPHQSVQRDHH